MALVARPCLVLLRPPARRSSPLTPSRPRRPERALCRSTPRRCWFVICDAHNSYSCLRLDRPGAPRILVGVARRAERRKAQPSAAPFGGRRHGPMSGGETVTCFITSAPSGAR